MKHESDLKPTKSFEIENIHNNRCEVVFFDLDSIEEIEKVDEEGKTYKSYLYNSYRQPMSYNSQLEEYIDENYETLLSKAKESDYEKVAQEVRAKRNALLDESDKDMAFDRLGINFDINIPSSITLSNVVSFIKELANALKEFGKLFKNINESKMAQYRQELRDITKQSGFPYNVVFPEKPDKE